MRKKQTPIQPTPISDDPNAANRKRDHIELAFQSQIPNHGLDKRFFYEPLLAAHPDATILKPFSFLHKTMNVPIWVSSMTGGTEFARVINHNLARACKDFGMGMGLGSCRGLLYSNEFLKDFDVRSTIGDALPLYANLGIAQIEQLIDRKELFLIEKLLEKLRADGLIIHINPMQEWLQPEGDRFLRPPLATIETVLSAYHFPIIVKEVGQGMGRESLKALFQLPISAIDFAAAGGTNFAKLELLRSNATKQSLFASLATVGHSAEEMVTMTNEILVELSDRVRCKQVIISGGIGNFLDGYYLTEKCNITAIYGQASAFLQYARGNYEDLYNFTAAQIEGLKVAKAFLTIKT
jgi:isopentenyl-diphosphate Delta-isomerase